MSSRIAHLFFDTHMGMSHDGLGSLLKKQAKVTVPEKGECAIFINRKWNRLKMLTSDGTILYLRRDEGINPEAIKFLPHCVDGDVLVYKTALEAAVSKRWQALKPGRKG